MFYDFLCCSCSIYVMFYGVFSDVHVIYFSDVLWCILRCSHNTYMMFYDVFLLKHHTYDVI
jgi:hypothetical protein